MATLSWFNTFLVEHSELWVMATLAEFTKVLNLGYDYFATTLAKVRFTGINTGNFTVLLRSYASHSTKSGPKWVIAKR